MTFNYLCGLVRPGLCGLALAVGALRPLPAQATVDQTFDVLQIGTTSYTNVTVTSKSKDYFFISHSTGMQNIRVAGLQRDVLQKLGYIAPDPVGISAEEKAQLATNAAAATAAAKLDLHNPGPWAKQRLEAIPLLQTPQAKKWMKYGRDQGATQSARIRTLDPVILYGAMGGLCLLYFVFAYACVMICRKAGNPGGLMACLPLLQVFPLLKAAGMTRWWVLTAPIPVLNLLAPIIWSFEIAKVLGKSALVGVLLLIPGISFFAFLYLAFSSNKPAEPARPQRELMSLETA